ncbi:branched-chain amino acid ABC transporter permease [Streptomyces sp. Isolate_45]|uniref:branched-chain amino acid ABC transporter permease n=1 Tax=Streptomyces sp. Isolate_45 TaxID=2950111 RepID=UPI002481F6AD|nr:branched-chain amino acid ABC transporter permease [Streptomyces sp. Isolate_45]MDA5282158.1 branched-chain amino acid ABC transporter permease [Streptomyces sp. Isolate_45]
MTTNTTETSPVIPLPATAARALTLVGALITIASAFLAWTWTDAFPGDLTVYGYPADLQMLTIVGGALTLLLAATGYGIRGLRWLNPSGGNNPTFLAAFGSLATTLFTLIAITVELGGLANLEPGGYVAAAGVILAFIGALGLPLDRKPVEDLPRWNWFLAVIVGIAIYALYRHIRLGRREGKLPKARELPSWAEILIVAATFAVGLFVVTYGIDTPDKEPQLFFAYLLIVAFATAALTKSGLVERLSAIIAKHRQVTLIATAAAAIAFPFIQQSGDTYTLIAVNILIFATVALGLNVVVGLAGLLDLGYVAFLGVGAYAAALVSGSTASAFGIHLPFWAAVIVGALASLIFGVVIGAPTLRLRGDYLAIVTLGFGEIFRIAMGNLDGTSGPDITNGPNGIPNIPHLELFGWNFGESHNVGGIVLGAYANYYFLMLLVMALVIVVFARAGNSRIGRAWVAIREDETAAEAMGINGFKVKLIAFALGATLAGLAGTVQAHVNSTVVPENYVFAGPVPPNSAFLLAAVILGGMGTIRGPILGAALLFLIPAKLAFLQDYQLLAFGIALILLMRFRPEGLIANKRAQLEYHDDTAGQAPTDLATAKAGA